MFGITAPLFSIAERELDQGEKPLEIALDYSTKGLSSPSFMLKTSSSFSVQTVSTPKHTPNHISISSLAASSQSSLGHTSSDGSESPQVVDNENLYNASFSSTMSVPVYNSFTHPPRAQHRPINKTHSQAATSIHHSKQSFTKSLTHSHNSDPMLRVPDSPGPLNSSSPSQTPEMSRKVLKKSRVSNLMDNIARSLKSKSKTRPTTIYPEEYKHKLNEPLQQSPLLESPVADRRFSMPTVFHVYFSHAKNAQVYKSILISEHSTTLEVVKLALERYGMKFVNPHEYSLHEVVGKWEAIAPGDDNPLQLPPNEQDLGTKTKSPPIMEEFVTYYTREIAEKEKPYAVQTYSTMPDGYHRRFELRGKEDTVNGDKPSVPSTPLFGSTMHRGRSDTGESREFPFPSVSEETGDTEQDVPVVQYRHSLPDVLDCSSPDSGLETKSSCTSDQSDSQSWSLYPVLSTGAFLLNLQLSVIEKEFLVYRIVSDTLVLMAGTPPQKNNPTPSNIVQQEVELNIPDGDGSVVCSITKEEDSSYVLRLVSESINVYINAVPVSGTIGLQHGDLLKIGNTHLFMFQCPSGSAPTPWPYRWSPVKTVGHPTSTTVTTTPSEKATVSQVAVSSSVLMSSVPVDSVMLEEVHKPSLPAKVVYISSDPNMPMETGTKLPTVQEIEGLSENQPLPAQPPRLRSHSDSQKSMPPITSSTKKRRAVALAAAARHRTVPDDKKLMFSHDISEENMILDLLITKLDPQQTTFKLAPAYIIAMCLEYSIKCNGTVAASRFTCKAIESIQQTSWVREQAFNNVCISFLVF